MFRARRYRKLIGLAGVLLWADAGRAAQPSSMPADPRITRIWTFHEPDNFESVPMNWIKRSKLDYRSADDDPRFPHFLEGRFDPAVGYSAPPSFRLQLAGGSLAYAYHQQDTPILEGCPHRVAAFARPERLQHARAYMTAYYLNRWGVPMEPTAGSRGLGPADNGQWHKLTADLPEPPQDAKYVGITLWLTQPSVWDKSAATQPATKAEDAKAAVWFDDIGIYRLPKLSLDLGRQSRLFAPDEDPVVDVTARDPNPAGIEIRLTVCDVLGTKIVEQNMPAETRTLRDLDPGLYTVRVEAVGGDGSLLAMNDQFVKLRRLPWELSLPAARFGVWLSEQDVMRSDIIVEYIEAMGVGRVKVPVWRPGLTRDEIKMGDPATKTILRGLTSRGLRVTGVLAKLPAWLAEELALASDDVLEAFGHKGSQLATAYSYTATHYSGAIDYWQLGSDDRRMAADYTNEPATQAVQGCRRLLGALHGKIALALPHNMLHLIQGPIPSEAVSLYVPPAIGPEAIPAYLDSFSPATDQRCWVVMESADSGDASHGRIEGVVDLAKRMVLSQFSKAETIFIPPCWHLTPAEDGAGRLVPDAGIIIARTISHLLAGAQPIAQVPMDSETTGYLFRGPRGGLLAVWSNAASTQPRTQGLSLGRNLSVIDIWGRARTLAADADGQVRLDIGSDPVFIDGVDADLTQLWSSFAIAPTELDASYLPQIATVRVRNPFDRPLRGQLTLTPPRGWTIEPTKIPISLAARAAMSRQIEVQTPLSALAGGKTIGALLTVEAPASYRIPQITRVTLGCRGVDVQAEGKRRGPDFVVRVTVLNKSPEPLTASLRLAPPNRPRRDQMISYLQPETATVREFVIPDCADLAGRAIPIQFRQSSGQRFLNKEIVVW